MQRVRCSREREREREKQPANGVAGAAADRPDLDVVVHLDAQLLRLLGVLSARVQLEAKPVLHTAITGVSE
jgi:hypothetical protein